MANHEVNTGRRRFLTATTAVVGAGGAIAAAVPFLASWQPSAKAQGAGAPVTEDISKLEPGQRMIVQWRGQPVWIFRRTPEQLSALPANDSRLRDPNSENPDQQPEYAKNGYRSIKPEIAVLVGTCTHLGCSPLFRPELEPQPFDAEWKGGFYCPCHNSRFDMAGRVYEGVPAPTNLRVPPYKFLDENRIVIGVNPERSCVMANVIERTVGNVADWFTERTPGFLPFYKKHLSEYYAPKNFNVWYYFGSLAMLVLVNQIVTGIWLTMNYKPSAAEAFNSVEYIMRDVDWGWLIRYMHSTGASLFFVVVYLHMFRGLIYGSYKKPRELVWVVGMLIFLTLMAEAFMGYVLPWGQMSYWGAQVIINLFGAVPWIGEALTEFIRGDYLVSDATLNRFFALHVIALPLVILLLVVLHLGALHEVGSNNPEGIEIKKKKDANGKPLDGIPFHPYYTVKDLFGAGFFLTIAAFILFFEPTFGGLFLEYDNFVVANPLVTPEHIKPVWYFTPYYAMLRAVPDKLLGVMVMGGAVLILFLVPWLDYSGVKSVRYRGMITKVMLTLFVIAFVTLGWLGLQAGSTEQTWAARVFTLYYFGFFITMPIWTRIDAVKSVPDRVPAHD